MIFTAVYRLTSSQPADTLARELFSYGLDVVVANAPDHIILVGRGTRAQHLAYIRDVFPVDTLSDDAGDDDHLWHDVRPIFNIRH
jgi:hypothetical protein